MIFGPFVGGFLFEVRQKIDIINAIKKQII